MKTDRLYFNEQEVDYNRELNISANYQINTFENLDSFQASYTNSISLPKTERNIQIFRGLGIEGNDSNVAYRVNRVSYVRNGFLQFENASAIVREITDAFRINLYFQNNSLFETIEGQNLSDLQLSQFNHELDLTGYIERLPDGVVTYPVANYGAQTDSDVVFEYQSPAIKVSYLWNRIFNEAGFSYVYKGRGNRNDFNPFESDEFKNARITLEKGIEETKDAETENVIEASRSNNEAFENFFIIIAQGTPYEQIVWDLPFTINRFVGFQNNTVQSDKATLLNSGNVGIQESGYFLINISGEVLGNFLQKLDLRIRRNGLIIAEVESISEGVNEIGFSERFYFEENDIVDFQFEAENEENNEPLGYSYQLNLNMALDNQFRSVNFSEQFQNISQTDFIKSIANKFGLIFVQKGNLYEFISIKELLTPFARYSDLNQFSPKNFTTEDWSGKFHNEIKTKTKLSNQWGQRSWLKYQYSNPLDTFADSFFDVNDQTLKTETTVLRSVFNAPETSRIRVVNSNLRRIPLYEIEEEGVKPLRSRPFIINTNKRVGSFRYKQIGGAPNTYTGEFEIATFRGLSYNELKNKWLEPLQNVLDNTEVKEVEVSLSEKDIAELNWFTLKYIKQLNGLFYLSRIINFTNEETTRVELVKVNPIEQLGAFNDDFNEDFDI